VLKQVPPTATRTPTATATLPGPTSQPSATPTQSQPAQPASVSITALSGSSNPEYVDITNSGGSGQNMTGWTLVSAIGPQTYNFPNGFVLGAGATVGIESYTAATSNPPAIMLWSTGPIWNNAGDRAELYNSGNGLVDSECYATGCP